jgi:hypothetical protein
VKPISLPAKIATMRTHQRRYETFAVEPRDAHLLAMIDRVEACLRVARMLARRGEQRDRVREAVALARRARGEAPAARSAISCSSRAANSEFLAASWVLRVSEQLFGRLDLWMPAAVEPFPTRTAA